MDALDDFDVDDELLAGAGAAVFVGAAVLVTAAGGLFADDEEELSELPHPAAMRPAAASASNGNPPAT